MFLTATSQLCSAPAVAKVYRWFWSGLCTQSWVWLFAHWFGYLMGMIPTRQPLLSHPINKGTQSRRAHSASGHPRLGNRHFLKAVLWISICIQKGTVLDHLVNPETHWDVVIRSKLHEKVTDTHVILSKTFLYFPRRYTSALFNFFGSEEEERVDQVCPDLHTNRKEAKVIT